MKDKRAQNATPKKHSRFGFFFLSFGKSANRFINTKSIRIHYLTDKYNFFFVQHYICECHPVVQLATFCLSLVLTDVANSYALFLYAAFFTLFIFFFHFVPFRFLRSMFAYVSNGFQIFFKCDLVPRRVNETLCTLGSANQNRFVTTDGVCNLEVYTWIDWAAIKIAYECATVMA